MTVAHVAAFPLEELAALVPAAGVVWIALLARVRARGPLRG